MKIKSVFAGTLLAGSLLAAPALYAADYVIDTKGAHASINFRVNHLGYSWLKGRFNKFEGQFSFDEANPADTQVSVEIDTRSVDSNHAERDKHIRDEDFLYVSKYPQATFESTAFSMNGDGTGLLSGNLTLRGVTKPVDIVVTKIGEGKDPWGGYRAGFSGTTAFQMKDFGIPKELGPASETVYLDLHVEGVRQ
ncbi:MAG: YceI family protein [Pseudomonadales bacterium]|jgi:polyisoprenoid-binding protein YceI